MRARLASALALALLPASVGAAAPLVDVEPVATGLAAVVGIAAPGDGSPRLFFVSQYGRIFVWNGTSVLPTPFLDIHAIVKQPMLKEGIEQGLLGLVFHPGYGSTGFFYVYYTNLAGDNVVARYHVSSDPNVADPASGTILLTLLHPTYDNHNGGQLQFGPDGYLYIGTGDGGGEGDPLENSQNLGSLLGKLLRIDVDHGALYAIPPGNPFVGTPGARPEIWAYGLRNPWRFSFDRQQHDLLIADVGQSAWEELDLQPAGSAGGQNYGWDDMEGAHCYEPPSGCATAGRVLPVFEYDHSQGACTIIGGYRYRGTAIPALRGQYVYGDFCREGIFGATQNASGSWTAAQVGYLSQTQGNILTFGEDDAGELYVSMNWFSSTVYRIVKYRPNIGVYDTTVAEGTAGTTSAAFTLWAIPSDEPITAHWSTQPGTATSGADYLPASGTVTFPPSPHISQEAVVTVAVVGDATDEDDETFRLVLDAVTGGIIYDPEGVATVLDDDPPPVLAPSECAALEGDTAMQPCRVHLRLLPSSEKTVSASYTTVGGSAQPGVDFVSAAGTLTFAPGEVERAVDVVVIDDRTFEADEQFFVQLGPVSNATPAPALVAGVILDDDAPFVSAVELAHGARVDADFAGGTSDAYRLRLDPYSSYEAVLDGVSGDAAPGAHLLLTNADLTGVFASSAPVGTGTAARLLFGNDHGAPIVDRYLRVTGATCDTACDAQDTYRLRLLDTTGRIPRFNDAGGQVSVLVLQNPSESPLSGNARFFSPLGTMLAEVPFSIPDHGTFVYDTTRHTLLRGQSGSVTVSALAPYGRPVGKIVTIDPAGGFAFDSPLEPRPR